MRTPRVGAKIFSGDVEPVELAPFIGAFHGWIQRRALDGLLIDVADYQHVPGGPGVMLIGHEADRALDLGGGGPGMLYQHKRDDDPPELADGVRRALRQAALAAVAAEEDPALPGLTRFRADRLMVRVVDRSAAPSGPESQAVLDAAVREVLAGIGCADGAELRPDDDPREPVAAFVTLASDPGAAGLAEALAHAPAVAG